MAASECDDVILKKDDEVHEKGDSFKSYHHQAREPLSRPAMLAGFLSVWLKRCVVPFPLRDRISPTMLFLVVQLVYGRALGLLPTMVRSVQYGLRTLVDTSCREGISRKAGKEIVVPRDGPCSRIEL